MFLAEINARNSTIFSSQNVSRHLLKSLLSLLSKKKNLLKLVYEFKPTIYGVVHYSRKQSLRKKTNI